MQLFMYFGTKVRLAGFYPRPRYKTVVEPFAGAAGYSAQYPNRNVVLYEKDTVTFAVMDYLIKATPKDILDLPLVPPGKSVDDFRLTDAQKWLIGYWIKVTAVPGKKLTSWGKEKFLRNTGGYWDARCRSILATTVTKIKHWKVYNASYETIDVDAIGPATWFVDPPYQVMGKHYKKKASSIDFPSLGRWCRSLPGQVIVCENTGADWLPFRFLCNQRGCGHDKHGSPVKSSEVIWTKGCTDYPTLLGGSQS